MTLRTLAACSLLLLTGIIACSSQATATKQDKLCTPGAYVFCRCQDRQEGTKLCKEDAASFGPCEPCESSTNPEGPLEPGDPGPGDPVDQDAGTEKPQDSGPDPNGSCGDGIVQNGEDCDDKNGDPNDGCDTSCKLSGTTPLASNSCPGLEVHVWGGAHKPTLSSTNSGAGNHSVKTTCGSATGDVPTSGAAGADRVFKVVAHKTGSMQVVTTDTTFNNFLYVSATTCPTDQVEWLACANKNGAIGGESMSFPVDSGKTYYVFVDGAGISDYTGTFRVTFSIP